MAVLSEFEYDIFISYRHNDNLDGWVTDFVQNLEKELRGTLKDAVTIYFDKNPHDGLLEIHNVDKSLEGKLKCLIFIPIISQTYCDPKSFAWQHEFCAFNKLSKEDQFGRDIKLNHGNVASRILPIKIHELDAEDKATFENEIGGVLRAIEFIYKEPGVNRPLAVADNKNDNLNKTDYKNQINKVANAIKEIITAIQRGPEKTSGFKVNSNTSSTARTNPKRTKMLVGMATALIVLVAYFITTNWRSSSAESSASQASIAILPFLNNTGKTEMDYYGLGVASEIRTQLAVAKQFDFISSMQSTIAYKNSVEEPKNIGEKLGVTHIITGIYQGVENNLQGVVELVEASSGKIVWSLPFNTQASDFYNLQASIANDVISQFKGREIQKPTSTTNLQAFAEVARGSEIMSRTGFPPAQLPAQVHFKRAIQLDSGYLKAWVRLTELYTYYHFVSPNDTAVKASQAEDLIKYISAHFEDTWEKKEIIALYTYQGLQEYEKALALFLEVLDENPNADIASDYISAIYKRKLNAKMALKYRLRSLNMNSNDVQNWMELGVILRNNGDYALAAQAFRNDESPRGFREYETQYDLNKLSILSDKTRKGNQKKLECDQYYLDRNFAGLLRHLGNLKTDSTVTQRDIDTYKLYTYYNLKQRDSVKLYARKLEQPKPQYKSNQSVVVFQKNSGALSASLLAGKSMLNDFYDTESKKYNQDMMLQAYMKPRQIEIAVFLENFKEATDLLTSLNQNYPGFGYYAWLNRPEYDRIKKEYPPFQEAINNLKLPPKTLDLGGLKL